MAEINGENAFTQLTKLNVIDKLLVNGLPIGGIVFMSIIEVTSNYLALTTDDVILGTGTFNVTLPPVASGVKSLSIKSTTGSVITVIPDGSELIEGLSTKVLSSEESITIVPTNNNDWQII